jgi:ligand-binding sensor domain-containing protein
MAKNMSVKAICFLFLAFFVSSAFSVTTSIWEQNTFKDFASGKPKNVSLTSRDQITLSKVLEAIEGNIPEVRIWCILRDSKGDMYAGTGDNGRIYKISSDGKATMIFDSPETDIISLVIDNNDVLYAGSSPDGIIYKIEQDRVPSTFFKSKEKYIWSMIFDDMGNLYAGTGINGKLYKISQDGKGEVVYDSSETHIKCLLRDKNNIYAGSESGGIIYRISTDGKAFVLYDTPGNEISSLVMGLDGNIYASVVSGRTKPPTRESQEQSSQGKEERESVIYQITPDGVATQVWQCLDPIIFTMIADGENLIVGTGDEGDIYSVQKNGDWTLIADCEESQVLSLYKAKNDGEIWLATGNPSKIYKISSNYVKEGTIESDKLDTSVISKWGNISWSADVPENTGIALSTRTGNTEKPDDTWSAWSDDYLSTMQNTSPPARFIQWKAKITSNDGITTPILKSISVAYLQKNLKPVIDSVTVTSEQDRPEAQQRRPPAQNPAGLSQGKDNTPMSGKKNIKWQAKDPNEDTLEYSVYFRGEDEKNWKLLKGELKATSYPIDTESFPDGAYYIKVVAVDSPSNPSNMALSEEKISERFVVDNTPPVILDLKGELMTNETKYIISGRIEDNISYIKEIVYSVDGADWKPLSSIDQILDSKNESFLFVTEQLGGGEHTVVIKTTDSAGNTGSAKAVIGK